MVQITYTLRLDMRDTGIVDTSLRLKQGDSGMKIAVNVFNGGVSAFDSSTTPKIVFRRPDGASVMADMTVESSLYSYTLVGNELQVPGKELIDIKFPIGAEGRESTMSCSIEVVPDTITPNTHGSGIYDNDLAVLVEEATEAAETVQEVVGDSEAWANGERNGVPVGPDDPAYHNNSKYWSEQANPTALANLTDIDVDGVVNGDLLQYNSTTHKWEASNTVIEQIEDNAEGIEELNESCKVNGAYNILPNNATAQVTGEVTWTVDSNGNVSATVASTTSQNRSITIYSGTALNVSGLKAVGTPTTEDAKMTVTYSDNTTADETGNGLILGSNVKTVILTVKSGTTAQTIVFNPMITADLNATYNDYQPYAKTNRELTFVSKTFTDTTDANGIIASNLPFNNKRFGFYAQLDGGGTAFVLQRPYSSNLTAFWLTIGTSVTANKTVTIYYYEYVE